MTTPHPLSPLNEAEIVSAAGLIRSQLAPGTKLRFKGITLHEPSKAALKKYDSHGLRPSRCAWVNYYIVGTSRFYEATINLAGPKVERLVTVPAGLHGPCDDDEILEVERLTLADVRVKDEIAKLQLPAGTVVVCDPWIWGADGVADDVRQYQCFLYLRDPSNSSEPDSNHYAFPLKFSPVFDTVTMQVTRIESLPSGADFATKPTQPITAISKPMEYIPEAWNLRDDLKALSINQPDGPSFKIEDDVLKWQKWEMRMSFNSREGTVLHQVKYDGRPLFYRVSLSDMSVPYADPRPPFHKKQAFDLGDTGAGLTANNLELGCDCLGAIMYRDGLIADDQGRPMWKRNAVCIHEQDAGLLWKHTNYRTGRAAVVRRRELVIQSIITVSNYEYVLAFIFDQTGQMEYEARATGILSTQPIEPGIQVPWGTVVHDGVLAVYHQHIFSLRIDPELDGGPNRLVAEETTPMPRHPNTNPHGNGYVCSRSLIDKAGGYDLDSSKNRVFAIENPSVQNPVNGKNVAYKIHVPAMQPLLADQTSYHFKRADFADHAIYVTKFREDQLFAGGQYTNQNKTTSGVRKWSEDAENLTDEDIVVWIQFGLQHVPRIEDFPVMPAEIIKVALKPVNFFTHNPAIDVPPSSQTSNKSVLVNGSCNGSNGCAS